MPSAAAIDQGGFREGVYCRAVNTDAIDVAFWVEAYRAEL